VGSAVSSGVVQGAVFLVFPEVCRRRRSSSTHSSSGMLSPSELTKVSAV
jgi:hypothetical protein